MTNYQKIMQLPAEELAHYLVKSESVDIGDEMSNGEMGTYYIDVYKAPGDELSHNDYEEAVEAAIEWLNREVDDESDSFQESLINRGVQHSEIYIPKRDENGTPIITSDFAEGWEWDDDRDDYCAGWVKGIKTHSKTHSNAEQCGNRWVNRWVSSSGLHT